MLFSTLPQLIALIVLFLSGIFLGLGLHPGGQKWRKRFRDESNNYAQYRSNADLRFREAKARIDELERELTLAQVNEAVTHRVPSKTVVKPSTILAAATADKTPLALTTVEELATPSEPVPAATGAAPRASWFSKDDADDLGRIRSVDPALKDRLHDLGMTRYEDITSLSALDEMALEQRLGVPAGFITREQWRDQATLLQAGRSDDHAEQFPSR